MRLLEEGNLNVENCAILGRTFNCDLVREGTGFVLTVVAIAVTVGCGGGSQSSSGPPPKPVTSVSINPTSAVIQVASSQRFSAAVTGGSTGSVVWSASATGRSSPGTISSSGNYIAPTSLSQSENVTITATSVDDPSKFASATVTITSAIRVTLSSPAFETISVPPFYQ